MAEAEGEIRSLFDTRAQQRKAGVTATLEEAAQAAGHAKMPREKLVAVVLWCSALGDPTVILCPECVAMVG